MDKTTVKFSENETIAIQFMALCVSDLLVSNRKLRKPTNELVEVCQLLEKFLKEDNYYYLSLPSGEVKGYVEVKLSMNEANLLVLLMLCLVKDKVQVGMVYQIQDCEFTSEELLRSCVELTNKLIVLSNLEDLCRYMLEERK